jgi:hypothetical protein
MEYGSTLGTYLAYAAILLVLLVMAAAFLRALMMPAALVLLQFARRVGRYRAGSAARASDLNTESHEKGV